MCVFSSSSTRFLCSLPFEIINKRNGSGIGKLMAHKMKVTKKWLEIYTYRNTLHVSGREGERACWVERRILKKNPDILFETWKDGSVYVFFPSCFFEIGLEIELRVLNLPHLNWKLTFIFEERKKRTNERASEQTE